MKTSHQAFSVVQSVQLAKEEEVLDEKEGMLREIEDAMKNEIERVKASFELQRKELERREQETLKEVYDSFGRHLKLIDEPITHQKEAE